jgi:deoxyhypusine synthase
MEGTHVLGAGRFAKAVAILTGMWRDGRYSNILAFAGPLVPGGLRGLFRDLIAEGYVHAVITTGANITHDIVEALGYRHIAGSPDMNDRELRKKNLSRIYDILISQSAIERLEKLVYGFLKQIPEEKRQNIASFELLWEFGKRLKKNDSILATAYSKQVPIFCPGIYDSMLGLHLWTFAQLNTLLVNPMRDFTKLVDLTYEAKKTGLIILGGGMPKHHAMIANIYRGGTDAAIQITLDRPEGGGTSGAPLEEAISWGKIRSPNRLATVVGDATILFPLIAMAALERVRK